MTLAILLPVVTASLLGSLHCAAMCGPFVAAYAGTGQRGSELWLSHVTYNAGRLITYSALGAAAGGLGQALDLAGKAAGLGHAAAIVSGILLVSLGVFKLTRGQKLIELKRRAPRSLFGFPVRLMASFARQPPLLRSGLLGLSSTLLPCGWLYAFAAAAAGTASVANGAAMMSAFWLGSLPVMLGVGVSFQALSQRFRKHVPRLSAALLVAVGILTLLTRLNLPAFAAGGASECSCHRKAHGPDAARVEPK